MSSVEIFQWRQALVYGLGLSGLAAARLLRSRGVEVVAVDRRPAASIELGDLAADRHFRVLAGGELEGLPEDVTWPEIDAVVASPGVPVGKPLFEAARGAGVPVLGELELAFAFARGDVLGITGSNGKSTTTSLAGAMLRAAGVETRVCGNIGEPFAAAVMSGGKGRDAPSAPVFVVEVSSFQLETVDRFHPRAAALLNLAPDHLDRHGGFEAYAGAKLRLFERQEASDVAVLNADDPEVVRVTAGLVSRRRFFSRREPVADGCHLLGDSVVEVVPGQEPRPLFAATDVPLPGPHNLENAMAAALLALAGGADPAAIRRALHGFRGLPHRLQKVAERGGVQWFDDSKGTNVAATLGSLSGFEDGRVLVILGGQFKGGDTAELARLVARKARRAYLIGEAAERFEKALRGFPGMTTGIETAGTLEQAVESAAAEARPGDVVLLSPACASFDQFTDYADRGRTFQRLVAAREEVPHGA